MRTGCGARPSVRHRLPHVQRTWATAPESSELTIRQVGAWRGSVDRVHDLILLFALLLCAGSLSGGRLLGTSAWPVNRLFDLFNDLPESVTHAREVKTRGRLCVAAQSADAEQLLHRCAENLSQALELLRVWLGLPKLPPANGAFLFPDLVGESALRPTLRIA